LHVSTISGTPDTSPTQNLDSGHLGPCGRSVRPASEDHTAAGPRTEPKRYDDQIEQVALLIADAVTLAKGMILTKKIEKVI
jgi:hypothetical protein